MFKDTVDKVVAGYSFQRYVLREVTTKQFGTWLANHTTLDVADRVVAVFNDCEKIVTYLTDERMINVECTRWSVNYFHRAKSWKFGQQRSTKVDKGFITQNNLCHFSFLNGLKI